MESGTDTVHTHAILRWSIERDELLKIVMGKNTELGENHCQWTDDKCIIELFYLLSTLVILDPSGISRC